VLEAFPELAFVARRATRLHPRPGTPGVRDSSVGGPLLWPAGEPWPVCEEFHGHRSLVSELRRPADERSRRRLLAEICGRTKAGEPLRPSDRERSALAALGTASRGPMAGPVPLLPLAQLYGREVPGWFGPPGADLVQLLWCPFRHAWHDDAPAVVVRWRSAAEVRAVLTRAPSEPELMHGTGFLPEPCLLHPEEVVEFPYVGMLPPSLYDRMARWEDETGYRYHFDLSLADGWKLGGWAAWTLTDDYPPACECGAPMRLLLTVSGSEWTGTGSWRPVEDAVPADVREFPPRDRPTLVTIGRGHRLLVFVCEETPGHPCRTAVR
jgi:hypothetical protein